MKIKLEKTESYIIEKLRKETETKIIMFENKLNTLTKALAEKDSYVNTLEKRIEDMENRLDQPTTTVTKKIKELENKNDMLAEKITNLESISKVAEEKINCTICDFLDSSKQGLNLYIKRKHKPEKI